MSNQKAHHVIDVTELSATVQAGQADIDELKGKDVVLVLGKTGVGKSFFIQLINGAIARRHESSNNVYCVVENERYLPNFEVGYERCSKTKCVRSYYHEPSGLVFCDFPGYKDTNSCHTDIATAVWINDIARVCKSLRFALLIHYGSLFDEKGNSFRDLMTLMTKLMKNDPMSLSKSIMVFFTHASDFVNEERDEDVALLEIEEEIKQISLAFGKAEHKKNYCMKLIRSCITMNNGHVRILNPVTTDVQKIVDFLTHQTIPIESAENYVQCSLPREVELAVRFAMTKLDSAVKEALFSINVEKQANLHDLMRLMLALTKMLGKEKYQEALNCTLESVSSEYGLCKESIMYVVDSTCMSNSSLHENTTVVGNRKVSILGKEEVESVVPKFKKLKLLHKILQEVEIYNGIGVGSNDVTNIQLEYHRKLLLFKIDALGMIQTTLDFAIVFYQLENIKYLENLKHVIGETHDE